MIEQHSTPEEARQRFQMSVDNTIAQDRWLGVVFSVGEDGRLSLSRTRHRFPTERLGEALALLRANLAEDALGAPTPIEPLPLAPELVEQAGQIDPSETLRGDGGGL